MQRMSKKRKKDLLVYIVLLAFPMIQFAIFYVYVNFNSILLSFKNYAFENGRYELSFAGFDNFKKVFDNFFGASANLRYALRNSFVIYFAKLIISLPISVLLSYYFFKKFFLTPALRVVAFIPSIASAVATALIYKTIFNEIYPSLFEALFKKTTTSPIVSKPLLMSTVFSLWVSFGSSMVLYSGAMSRIPTSVLEAAKIDGINNFKELVYIILPLMWPTISTLLIVGVAGVFNDQNSLYEMFAGGVDPKDQLIGYYLFVETRNSTSYTAYPYLSAFGLVETLIVVPLTMLVRYLFSKVGLNDLEF